MNLKFPVKFIFNFDLFMMIKKQQPAWIKSNVLTYASVASWCCIRLFVFGETNDSKKRVVLMELLQIMSAVSDIFPSVLSLHIALGAIFPYPGSCTIAKSDSFARPGNFIQTH